MSKATTSLVVVVLCIGSTGCADRNAVIEIPAGYVGWVTIAYNTEECPGEDTNRWVSVIRVRPNGWACSTTWNGAEGLTRLKYYYVDDRGRRVHELTSTGWGEGGEVWAGSGTPAEDKSHVFIGTEQAFKDTEIGHAMADRLRESAND